MGGYRRQLWQREQESWSSSARAGRKRKLEAKQSKQFIRNICKLSGHQKPEKTSMTTKNGSIFGIWYSDEFGYTPRCTRCNEVLDLERLQVGKIGMSMGIVVQKNIGKTGPHKSTKGST